jgi:hypothetical protein
LDIALVDLVLRCKDTEKIAHLQILSKKVIEVLKILKDKAPTAQ